MRGHSLTQDQAHAIYDALAQSCVSVVLSFSYRERLTPAEHYQVSVPVGPGRMSADELRTVMGIADDHGCEAHLLGDGLLILPVAT